MRSQRRTNLRKMSVDIDGVALLEDALLHAPHELDPALEDEHSALKLLLRPLPPTAAFEDAEAAFHQKSANCPHQLIEQWVNT